MSAAPKLWPALTPGLRVRVFLNPQVRTIPEGEATLLQLVRKHPAWRPLETWIVDLEAVLELVEETRRVRHPCVQRIVHPADVLPWETRT